MKTVDTRIRLAGERRQVTALFYDIVGSTELLVRSDPEVFFRSVANLHQTADAIVTKHGGILHQKLGDGGCCFFGYPVQSEDAAESAVQASLELIDAEARRSSRSRPPFKLRVGVATGVVVFSSDGEEIVGTAPILAARLQAEAQPNSVLVADSTFQLTRHRFDYSFFRDAALKGFDSTISIWRPLAKKPARDRFSLVAQRSAPLRGRDQELSILSDAWRAACEGAGSSVVVVGDAGIGKSRLVAEFRNHLQGAEHVDTTLQCSARLENQPLHPFIGLLETLVGAAALKSGDSHLLREALRQAGSDVDAALVAVISEFAREGSRHNSGNIRATDSSGSVFRNQVINAASRILCSGASARPRLILFEDVHWADSMTLELLDRLGELAATMPVLVIQTSRDPRVEAAARHVTLSGLDSSAMRDLVASIWTEAPPSGLSDFILQQCDGMPLYAEELTHFLRARDDLGDGASRWKELLVEEGVSSLNDLLSARLAEVGHARRVAQLASVIGREFDMAMLAYLAEATDRQTVEADLSALEARGIIEPTSKRPGTYQFRHVLLQEAAYGSLLRSDRRRIHRRIAQLLVEDGYPGFPAAIAAWQCAEAGRHGDAARFALIAAQECVLRSAMAEASSSLDLCAREIAAMSRRHPGRSELSLDLLQHQGVVATALEGEGSSSARKIYSRAIDVLSKNPTTAREERFPLYWGWWFTAPNILTQQSRAKVLVEEMKAAQDPETRLQSYHCAWATSFHAGQHDFCLDCVARGLELYDPERALKNRSFFGGHDAKVCGLGESALSYLLVGNLEASEISIDQCLKWAVSTDHAGSMVHALYYAMVLRRCQGRYEDVHTLGEQMLSLAEQNGLVASKARANMYCGWAELMTSSPERGARRFQEGLSLQQQSGTDDNLSIHSDMHSQVLQRIGRPADSLALIENAIDLSRKSGQWFWLAELYRRRAEVGNAIGHRLPKVKEDLRKAVETAEGQGAAWLAGRASLDLQSLS